MSKRIFDIAVWIALVVLLYMRLPGIFRRFQTEGKRIEPIEVESKDGYTRLPILGKKRIVVFWATWCKPCDVELDRFQKAVAKGEIPAHQILAVSFGEPAEDVYRIAKERSYQFPIFVDPNADMARAFSVDSTPTIAHVNADGEINYLSSGLGPFTIMRSLYFLKD